jgi:hypothetical protein
LRTNLLITNVKWLRLKGEAKGVQKGTGKLEYASGEEVVVDYGGSRGAGSELPVDCADDDAGGGGSADDLPEPEVAHAAAAGDREERRTARAERRWPLV